MIYGNVRSLPETSLTANATTWKVIIDYPFDEPGHTTRDDLGKLQIYSQNNPNGTRTLVWLPAFFSETADARPEPAGDHRAHADRRAVQRVRRVPVAPGPQHGADAAGEPAEFAAASG